MTRLLAVIALTPVLAGCQQLDTIAGKSTSRENYEARQALLIPEPETVQIAATAPTAPACYKILRVRDCTEDGQEIWL